MLTSLVIMLLCLVLSGYFSATETAFSTFNRTRLKTMAENGNTRASLALSLSEDYDRLISAILIGNNIVNIVIASVGTVLFIRLTGDEELGTTVSTAIVTLVVLVFGEVTPKSIAKDYPESFALFSAPFLHLVILLFTPLNFLFAKWKGLIGRLFRPREDAKMSQEELLLLLDEVRQEGGIDEGESTLLRNAVEFGEMEAQDILTPRTDLTAAPVTAGKDELIGIFDHCGFSRIPIYEGSVDKIVGILHRMDFYTGGGISARPLGELIKPPLFVMSTEKLDTLLQELRSTKAHLAVVVDEYGGTQGIVTMEDVLEELVGEIWDEHDIAEEAVKPLDDGSWQIDGGLLLDDFCDLFHLKADSDSISVGGWVMEKIGRIPKEGDGFRCQNLNITVTRIERHRVKSVSVAKTDPDETV